MIGWDENDPRRISTTILNPLGEDFSVMRTTVLPSMLDNLAHNHAHRNPTASLYELGTIYTPTVKDGKADPDVLPHEEKILTLGSYGRLSFFQFKGVIEALLRELNIKGVNAQSVQCRRTVQHNRMFLDNLFQHIPYLCIQLFYQLLRILDVLADSLGYQFFHYERLEQFDCHFLRQTTLIDLQFRSNDDNGTSGVIYTLT